MIAVSGTYPDPPLDFTQWSPSLCGKLVHPQATQIDGNVYIRPASGSSTSLIVFAPTEGKGCAAQLASLDDFRKLWPEFEKNGVEIDRSSRSVLKGPDAGRFELQHAQPDAPAINLLPAEVRSILGWSEAEAKTPGAYPLR